MEIHIDNLNFAWPHSDFQLNIPRLKVASGQSLAIVGPSGSGKSTFLNLLAGMLIPVSGQIIVGSTSLQSIPDQKRRNFRQKNIGFVFQDFKLIEYLNVRENILTPWRLTETSAPLEKNIENRLQHLITQLSLASLMHRPVQRLSQGEQQRVAIARALCMEPGLILADEPTGNLDPTNKTLVRDLLSQEATHLNSTLVMVTHDRDLVSTFDQVIDFASFQSKRSQTSATS